MVDLAAELKKAMINGELEPWKAILLLEWVKTADLDKSPGPSAEDLARLLAHPPTLARLKLEAQGPWDMLATQARSILAHTHVGTALDAIDSK
jgi:hypothetical protein